ncbi:MAG TPA: GxxExxY protein [Anaerolineaceae bacterium]|nr:GxxExxY protein [Anaerolineaceae bacterium]
MNRDTHELSDKVLCREECYSIQGAALEVYREMGSGFLKAVYQECLLKEFTWRNIPFQAQVELPLAYKGVKIAQVCQPDFICYEKIIVEVKALKETSDEHRAQVFNMLKATGLRVGLLINFGHHPKVSLERILV